MNLITSVSELENLYLQLPQILILPWFNAKNTTLKCLSTVHKFYRFLFYRSEALMVNVKKTSYRQKWNLWENALWRHNSCSYCCGPCTLLYIALSLSHMLTHKMRSLCFLEKCRSEQVQPRLKWKSNYFKYFWSSNMLLRINCTYDIIQL